MKPTRPLCGDSAKLRFVIPAAAVAAIATACAADNVDPCEVHTESAYCVTRDAVDPTFSDRSDLLDMTIESTNITGGGLGWLDYDADGWLDLFVSNGDTAGDRLFKNSQGSFLDVAPSAGVDAISAGYGIAAADIDNDGYTDVVVVRTHDPGDAQPPHLLYHNNGDGTFTDISAAAGLVAAETGSPVSAAFGDIDNDGFLDLAVVDLGDIVGQRNYATRLYRNNGDLTFTDISAAAGVDTAHGGCAVTMSHHDDDGLLDIFVANCGTAAIEPTPLEIFRNNGDLTFTDVGPQAGVAVPGFWMGLTHADIDNDGDLDFFSTNAGTIGTGLSADPAPPNLVFGRSLDNTYHALFRNNGDGTYTDIADEAGVARWEFGWGCSLADFDNDGHVDLTMVGSAPVVENRAGPGRGNPGRILMNNGNGTFAEINPGLPIDLSSHFTFGLATADYDNNGFPDIAISSLSIDDALTPPDVDVPPGEITLLHNGGNANRWATIKLQGTTSNRDGVGALVRLVAGDLSQLKGVYAGSSFVATESPWLTFGIGSRSAIDFVEVTWPSGLVERFENVPTLQTSTLVEGTGAQP